MEQSLAFAGMGGTRMREILLCYRGRQACPTHPKQYVTVIAMFKREGFPLISWVCGQAHLWILEGSVDGTVSDEGYEKEQNTGDIRVMQSCWGPWGTMALTFVSPHLLQNRHHNVLVLFHAAGEVLGKSKEQPRNSILVIDRFHQH